MGMKSKRRTGICFGQTGAPLALVFRLVSPARAYRAMSAPALNFTTFFSGMVMDAPVAGLTP